MHEGMGMAGIGLDRPARSHPGMGACSFISVRRSNGFDFRMKKDARSLPPGMLWVLPMTRGLRVGRARYFTS